jgi:hypothetical protein
MRGARFAIALASLCFAPTVRADELQTELDCAANVRLFDTHFARFGYLPLNSINREEHGLRFKLPSAIKNIPQTGMYSYVALKGDFDISAEYEWIDVPPPKGGYGLSCGIAIDTLGAAGQVSLARAILPWKKNEHWIAFTQGKPDESGKMKYDTTPAAKTKALTGRLALRREKDELICLAADGAAELREVGRIPFTTETVRQVRLYADPGGSPTYVDMWMGGLKVRAEAITGAFRLVEKKPGLGWWPVFGVVVLAAALALVLLRRKLWKITPAVGRTERAAPARRRPSSPNRS